MLKLAENLSPLLRNRYGQKLRFRYLDANHLRLFGFAYICWAAVEAYTQFRVFT